MKKTIFDQCMDNFHNRLVTMEEWMLRKDDETFQKLYKFQQKIKNLSISVDQLIDLMLDINHKLNETKK